MWIHHVEAVGAALRNFALDCLRPPAVMVTGMGLPAVGTYVPTLADSALRRRRLLFVDPFACGYSDAPVSFSCSLWEQAWENPRGHARALAHAEDSGSFTDAA